MGSRLRNLMDMPVVDGRIHESVFRSYHILIYVKELLSRNTPPDVVLDIINGLEDKHTTLPQPETRKDTA